MRLFRLGDGRSRGPAVVPVSDFQNGVLRNLAMEVSCHTRVSIYTYLFVLYAETIWVERFTLCFPRVGNAERIHIFFCVLALCGGQELCQFTGSGAARLMVNGDEGDM